MSIYSSLYGRRHADLQLHFQRHAERQRLQPSRRCRSGHRRPDRQCADRDLCQLYLVETVCYIIGAVILILFWTVEKNLPEEQKAIKERS